MREPAMTAAEQALVIGGMTAVRCLAFSMHKKMPQTDLDALLSDASYGAIEAARRFEPGSSTFTTFMRGRVTGAMLDGIREKDWCSRVARSRGRKMADAEQLLTRKLQRDPEDEEIAALLEVSLVDLHQLREDMARSYVFDLDKPGRIDESGDEVDIKATVASQGEDQLDRVIRMDFADKMMEAVALLSIREQTILRMRFEDDMTLREIGLVHGVCMARVGQILAKCVVKLRKSLRGLAA